MKSLYTKICPICFNKFSYFRYKSEENFKPIQTCSRICSYKLRSSKLKGRYIPHIHNRRDITKWITSKCKNCGKEIHSQRSTKRIFCSRKCKGKWQSENCKGSNNPNWIPPEKKTQQKDVSRSLRKWLIDKRKRCANCDNKDKLQVHHIDRNREHNTEENLLLLCKSCHAEVHEKDGKNISKLILSNHKNST